MHWSIHTNSNVSETFVQIMQLTIKQEILLCLNLLKSIGLRSVACCIFETLLLNFEFWWIWDLPLIINFLDYKRLREHGNIWCLLYAKDCKEKVVKRTRSRWGTRHCVNDAKMFICTEVVLVWIENKTSQFKSSTGI